MAPAISYCVEYAQTKQSKCAVCDKFIILRTLRIGRLWRADKKVKKMFAEYTWHHLKCFTVPEVLVHLPLSILRGYDKLNEKDQASVKGLLGFGAGKTWADYIASLGITEDNEEGEQKGEKKRVRFDQEATTTKSVGDKRKRTDSSKPESQSRDRPLAKKPRTEQSRPEKPTGKPTEKPAFGKKPQAGASMDAKKPRTEKPAFGKKPSIKPTEKPAFGKKPSGKPAEKPAFGKPTARTEGKPSGGYKKQFVTPFNPRKSTYNDSQKEQQRQLQIQSQRPLSQAALNAQRRLQARSGKAPVGAAKALTPLQQSIAASRQQSKLLLAKLSKTKQ